MNKNRFERNVGTNNKIKVLHLIDQYRTGGPGKTIINTAKYIDHDRFVVHVGLFFSEKSAGSEFIDKIKEEGIPHLIMADKQGICLTNLRILLRYIKEERIGIIHTHGYKTDIHGVVLKILSRRLCLITTHHGWITNTSSQTFSMCIDLLATIFFDGITVVASPLLHKIPWLTRKTRKCIVIYNGLVITDYISNNHRQAIRDAWSITNNEIVFGVFGRLSPEKGCLEMLEAFALLQKEIDNVKLVYVGEGPLSETIKKRVKRLHLEKKVIVAGYYQQVQSLYEAIDVLACPSETEGLSNVILEAFAFRKPVVATRVGGNPEIIVNEENGLLVNFGDISGLKDRLLKLAQQPELRLLLGQAGYDTVVGRFNFHDRVKKEEHFYDDIISM